MSDPVIAVFMLGLFIFMVMLGFPIAISVAFIIILLTLPFLIEAFSRILDSGFETILRLFASAKEGGL